MQIFSPLVLFCFIFFLLFTTCNKPSNIIIDNKSVTINLGFDGTGVPAIQSIRWNERNTVIKNIEGTKDTENWIKELTGAKGSVSCNGWDISDDSLYYKAKAGFSIAPFYIELHVNLLKGAPHICCYYTIKNAGRTMHNVKRFPIFYGNWKIAGEKSVLKWWEALNYTPISDTITTDTYVTLQSRIHSSDNYNGVRGNVPYWQIQNSMGNIYFGLAWCGGWQSNFQGGSGNSMKISVSLPEHETQLSLKPGESISGPELFISPIAEPNEMMARSQWFSIRHHLAKKIYGIHEMGFPLIYNHWYAAEFNLSGEFIHNQLKCIPDYGFDAFVIDAGWYKGVGAWTPNLNKFLPGELEETIRFVKSKDIKAGLWSCPQLMKSNPSNIPKEIDIPGRYVPFMNAYLTDYAGSNFTNRLESHIDTLTQTLHADWWKFDQEFFANESRFGKMKNVIALQSAFESVRKLHPNLIIESCMGGGKMINEFSDKIAQIHWIKDGERSGYIHCISNISEAMGATEILEPQKVQRWSNRSNEVDTADPELMKLYCRSCMLGTWGISADLNKINPVQKATIVNEVHNYKKLNEIKKFELFEHEYPQEYSGNVYAAYYNDDFTKAGILFYRMFLRNEKVQRKIQLAVNPERTYRIVNADSEIVVEIPGIELTNGFSLVLDPQQLSTIYFVEAI